MPIMKFTNELIASIWSYLHSDKSKSAFNLHFFILSFPAIRI